MSTNDILPITCILLTFAFGGAALTIQNDARVNDPLAVRKGDMARDVYYGGDVVAKWAAESPAPVETKQSVVYDRLTENEKTMLDVLAKHMGRK